MFDCVYTTFLHNSCIYGLLLLPLPQNYSIMAEEAIKSKRGGKREGAGRKANGLGTVPMSLRIRKELLTVLDSHNITKNSYINEAIKDKLIKDGLI